MPFAHGFATTGGMDLLERRVAELEGELARDGVHLVDKEGVWHQRAIHQLLRVITLGVKEGFRRRGIDAVLYLDSLRIARELGYEGAEISWTLEDNDLMNRAIESLGGKRSKKYRIYERPL